MNLISFNIDDQLINKSGHKALTKKKNIFFDKSCKNNFFFNENKENYVFADVHNFQKNQKNKISYLKETYKEFLKYLTKILNKVHNENYNTKFWNNLIGVWLYRFISKTYSYWETLKKIEKKYKVNSYSIIKLNDKLFIPENSWHLNCQMGRQSKYNLFNHWLISKIIIFNKKKINILNLKKKINLKKEIKKLDNGLILQKIFYLSSNNKFFIYRWDVPRIFQFQLMYNFKFLNLSLGESKISKFESKIFDRENIFKTNKYKKKDSFKIFTKNILKYTLPKIFLENFKTLEREYLNSRWPKNPTYIVTSYPHYDEIFNYYCAKSINNGSKILITQHGPDNIYKYDDWFLNKIISEKQLTWIKKPKVDQKQFLFTKTYKKNVQDFKFIKNKKILLILYAFSEIEEKIPFGYSSYAKINEKIYFSSVNFLTNLDQNLRKITQIKSLELTKFNILNASLKKKINSLNFIKIDKSFLSVINDYNLTVHFFMGTPFFESMYLNKPCILILDREIQFKFDRDFSSIIPKLIKNKICFTNLYSAINFINKNYKNLESWWNSKETQHSVNQFCENYCRRSKNLKLDLSRISRI